MNASFRFLSYVRHGTAALPASADDLKPILKANQDVPLSFRVNNRADTEVKMTLRRQGPGDVTGIDARAIIRTDPPQGAAAFEPNYFPLIEFDRPDFPWLFTPASAGTRGRLRPWLVLVTVRRQNGVSLTFEPGKRLPQLMIEDPAKPGVELPDLVESWAWAHGQVIEVDPVLTVEQILTERQELNLSRLICPRRLEPNARYLACLVPAFEAGRLAGLGEEVPPAEEISLQPAWLSGASARAPVTLPVYYLWGFSTGAGGDFESLARQLAVRPLPPGVGRRPMLVKDLGFGLPDLGTIELEGALRPLDSPSIISQSTEEVTAFQEALRDLLNLPERLQKGEPSQANPVVAPPIYGSLQASVFELPPLSNGEATLEPWLQELNLDPRRRAAAGLGVTVVQDQQELLMAAAWEGLGDAREATRLLHHLPFARAVLSQVHQKHLAPLPPERLLQLTAPLHTRVRLSPETVSSRLRNSSIMREEAASTSFRRVLRPRGPLVSRLDRQKGSQVAIGLVQKLSTLSQVVVIKVVPNTGALSPEESAAPLNRIRNVLKTLEASGQTAPPATKRFAEAYTAVHEYFNAPFPNTTEPQPQPDVEKMEAVREKLLENLRPAVTLPRRVFSRLVATAGSPAAEPQPTALSPAEEPTPTLAPPVFPQPMVEPLRALSQDFLLPGAGDIPLDTVVLFETNTPFVEAYLAGANHEMSRELLWREFPNDQRATYFHNFWPAAGSASQMPPIHEWLPESALGGNFSLGDGQETLVLLVRGQLLLRYPDAIIYAVKAASPTQLGEEERHPLFRGRLDPDITYIGLKLTKEEALEEPGWFFVLEEQPTSPRFGLDVKRDPSLNPAGPPPRWKDLSWEDFTVPEGVHLRFEASPVTVQQPESLQWAFNAAHQAAILRQRPARVAIHARLLLKSLLES